MYAKMIHVCVPCCQEDLTDIQEMRSFHCCPHKWHFREKQLPSGANISIFVVYIIDTHYYHSKYRYYILVLFYGGFARELVIISNQSKCQWKVKITPLCQFPGSSRDMLRLPKLESQIVLADPSLLFHRILPPSQQLVTTQEGRSSQEYILIYGSYLG